MIDSHAHLHHRLIDDQLQEVISRFVKSGGKYIVNAGIDLKSCCKVIDQARRFSEILPALAIHPETLIPGADIHVSNANGKWIKNNLDELDKMLEKNDDIAAIGECGLDYYWVKKQDLPGRNSIFQNQKDLFTGHIDLAHKYGLPMVIHCRDKRGDKQCEEEILDLLVKKGNSCNRGVFHSYTGSLHYLKDILALGFYITFNGIVTYKSADNVRELLEEVPLERILIETDSPFLVPQKSRSAGVRVGEPAFVKEIGKYVAEIKNVSIERFWEAVEENFQKVFKEGCVLA